MTFQSGERWRVDAPATSPWIPRSVAFAARGELLWAGPSIGNPELMLASTAGDRSSAILYRDESPAGAIGPVLVCAGDQIGELFSAAQYPVGSARRTVVMGHDPRSTALNNQSFAPAWTYDPGVFSDRPVFIGTGPTAEHLVVATYAGSTVHVDWIDPDTGARNSRVSVAGTGLTALSISESTERIALIAGLDLWIVDRLGNVWHHEELLSSTAALALSEDGRVLAFGDFATVHVLAESAGMYVADEDVLGAASELPTDLSLDKTGARLAVGWWNFATGADVRLEVWELEQDRLLVSREQLGSIGGFQNFPEAVRISSDGSRAAFGLWGLDDSKPDLYLIDVATDTDLLTTDLPGSVRALELDETGTRVALGVKHGHANSFGTSGAVMLLDTGERDLQLLSPSQRGGSIDLATKYPNQTLTIVLYGCESQTGTTVSGWDGLNWIDTSKPFLWRKAVPDATGLSTRKLRIPDQPSVVGLEFGVQAIFFTSTEVAFSSELLHPVIL